MQKFRNCQSLNENVKCALFINNGFHLLKLHYLMLYVLKYNLTTI